MVVKAEVIYDRYGRKLYRCPLCGHVFAKASQYAKHIIKSHLLGGFRSKRLKKKLEVYRKVIENKLKTGSGLTLREEIIFRKLKLNGNL